MVEPRSLITCGGLIGPVEYRYVVTCLVIKTVLGFFGSEIIVLLMSILTSQHFNIPQPSSDNK